MFYLIQTIAYAAILYLLYLLFLRNKPVHRFNRAYLLLCAVAPVLLPFAEWDVFSRHDSLITTYLNIRMPEVTVTDGQFGEEIRQSYVWLWILYSAISFSLLAVAIYRWVKLSSWIARAEKIKTADYTLLINTGQGHGSWARYIFLQEADADERIIAHEAAHVRLKHTYDLGFLTIWQCLFWCNPFVHLIKKELKQVHEFEADAAVRADKAGYQQLLLTQFLKQCQLPFTHSFINHPIKRRIMMLNKKVNAGNNTRRIILISTASLLLAANIIWLQSCKTKKWELTNDNPAGSANSETTAPPAPPLPSSPPQPGVNITEFLAKNIRYPEEAKKNHIEGKVIVKFTVNTEGKVTNAKIVKSPNEALSQEALRVINLMPAWTPGEDANGKKVDVQLSQPIHFQLGNSSRRQSFLKQRDREWMAKSRSGIKAGENNDTPAAESDVSNLNMEERKKIFSRMINPFQSPDAGC